MAFTDLTAGNTPTGFAASHSGLVQRISKLIKFADILPGNGDILLLHRVPANTLVFGATAKILTLEGAALTVDIGDYTTAATPVEIAKDAYFDGLDLNSGTVPVWSATYDGAAAYAVGKFYSAAAYLTCLVNNAAANVAELELCWQLMVNAHFSPTYEQLTRLKYP